MVNTLIERKNIYNIGLECRLKKTAVNTIKGNREDDSGMIVSPQSYEINDYASKWFVYVVDDLAPHAFNKT